MASAKAETHCSAVPGQGCQCAPGQSQQDWHPSAGPAAAFRRTSAARHAQLVAGLRNSITVTSLPPLRPESRRSVQLSVPPSPQRHGFSDRNRPSRRASGSEPGGCLSDVNIGPTGGSLRLRSQGTHVLQPRPEVVWQVGLQSVAGVEHQPGVDITPIGFKVRVHAWERTLHRAKISGTGRFVSNQGPEACPVLKHGGVRRDPFRHAAAGWARSRRADPYLRIPPGSAPEMRNEQQGVSPAAFTTGTRIFAFTRRKCSIMFRITVEVMAG